MDFFMILNINILNFFLLFRFLNSASPKLDEPFHVIWQMPSGVWCPAKEIEVEFEKVLKNSGITSNYDDVWHEGEYSTIFYRSVYGYWPHYFEGEEPPYNGGLPQLGNLTAHLENVREAINTAMPELDNHGIACINMEQFRPLWQRNWGKKKIYRKKSLELVEEKFGDSSPSDQWLEDEAIKEFEYHARKYMVESLRLSRKMRPNAKWGYYNYPYCYNGNPISLHCDNWVRKGNNQMRWLWEESTGIYPSMYVTSSDHTDHEIAKFMYGNMEEGRRVSELVGGRPVYVYHKHKWGGPPPIRFYRPVTMLNGLRLAADFGLDGIILWGSSSDFRSHEDCSRSHKYITEVVAPYVIQLIKFTKICSKSLCNGNGRCVHRGTLNESFVEDVLRTAMKELIDWKIDERYSCRCYDGFSGNECRADKESVVGGAGRKFPVLYIFIIVILIGYC